MTIAKSRMKPIIDYSAAFNLFLSVHNKSIPPVWCGVVVILSNMLSRATKESNIDNRTQSRHSNITRQSYHNYVVNAGLKQLNVCLLLFYLFYNIAMFNGFRMILR